MADEPRAQRGRRIHVEGADPGWTGGRPAVPPGFQSATHPPPGATGTPSLGAAASQEVLARNEISTRDQVAGLAARLAVLRGRLDELGQQAVDAAGEAVAQAEKRFRDLRDRGLVDLADRHLSEAALLAERLRAAGAGLAGGAAGAAWTDPALTGEAPISRFVRVGSIETGGARFPAIVPLLGHAGCYVTGPREQVDGLLVAAVTRIVAQAPLKKLRLTVFDPKSRGALGRFAPLRQAVGTAFPTPTSDPRTLAERLAELRQAVSRDTEIVAAATSGDLIDLWRTAPVPEGILQVVVLLDYPYGIDESLQEQLLRIAATESPVRPVLLVGVDSSQPPARDVLPEELRRFLQPLEGAGRTWRLAGYPDALDVVDDGLPPDTVLAGVLAAAAERARSDAGPTVPLANLLAPDIAAPWSHDSTDGLDLAFGRTGQGALELSLRTENPPHPNMLVGGAVGTGKSNLLLDVIYGLATRYSPEEFELHLLDFKQGLEFARFAADAHGGDWLPHVRTLGLESDRAFGLAVLEWFLAELERRSERFKAAGHSGIVRYRRATGDKVPRLLLIVDEFHELFAGTDTERERAVEALERLARQGRVYGVHLLLASQTTSGLSALAVKGEGIFAQFPLRLSLKNTAAESEAILSQGNKAAADLTYRGEVVFNTNAGHSPETSNQVGVAAYAEPKAMAALQRQLWELGHADPPLVFLGKEYAEWPDHAPSVANRGLELWLGRPIAVEPAPRRHVVSEDADQAIAVLGQGRPGAPGPRDSLRTLVLTALSGLRGGEVVFLDGDGTEADPWFSEIEPRIRGAGVGFRRFDADASASWIRTELKGRIAERDASEPLLVVGMSVQRLRDLDLEEPGDPDDYGLEERSARTVLQDLARWGAQSRAYFVGGWNNLRTMEADLGSYGSGVALYLTVDLGLDDLRSIAGPGAQRLDGSPRVGVFDRSVGDRLEVVVPYSPTGIPGEDRT